MVKGNNSVDIRGVSLKLLQKISSLAAAKGNTAMTTRDICMEYIIPWTKSDMSSFVEMMEERHMTQPHEELGMTYKECFGNSNKASVFISHAWRYHFEDVVSAITLFVETEAAAGRGNEESHFFWVDLFFNNQNKAANLPFEWWSTTFKNAIGAINHTVVVMAPWSNPQPLTRAWCLWEIACSILTDSKLTVQFSKSEMHDFQQSIILDFNVAMSALVQVDVERAEAFSKGDRDRILSSVLALDNGAGYHYVNKLVSGKMRDWLIASAESLLEKQLRGMQGGTGDDNDVKPFMTANVVASILGDQGDLHRSIALYNLALNGLERIVGPESEAAIRVGQNLASSLTKTNDPTDLQEAGRLFMRGLKIRERCLGKLHRDTLHSRYLLGTWLFEVGDLGGAREALQVTHDGWEVVGSGSVGHLDTMTSLASVLSSLDNAEAAMKLYQSVLSVYMRDEVVNNATRMDSKSAPAGEASASSSASMDVHAVAREMSSGDTSGQLTPMALHAMGEYGALLFELDETEQAQHFLKVVFYGYQKIYGDDNVDTAEAAYNYAQACRMLQKNREVLQVINVAIPVFEQENHEFLEDALSLRDDCTRMSQKNESKRAAGPAFQKFFAVVKFLTSYKRHGKISDSSDTSLQQSMRSGKKPNMISEKRKVHHKSSKELFDYKTLF